jgi:23S rRNA pseudouridine2605 synthase
LNQQQLQFARAALWHQTADARLVTFDDAAAWLDDIGLCLFLPRHTQLPAPAPSFVEACSGAPAITPPPAAIATATELTTRLIEERRAIPLNLLGAVTEQPDFLVTPEILPWAAAVRGDRQWKTAPGGRTAPIVLRTWEALDREGELTAIQIQDRLGRELTEAAILRALIELWTNLRAMPIYASDQPTRWTLLKNRCPEQLATAANTAQATALSVLLSIYLRSAVAATAEEAEIFLSPLTARSRIREVIHGMMAARQFHTMSVGPQTLLFIEGSLPDNLPEPEPEKESAPPATSPRAPFRKAPRPTRWELPARGARPEHDHRPPWQKKPAAPHRPEPSANPGAAQPRPEATPDLSSPHDVRPSRPDSRPSFAARTNRPGTKPRFGSRPDSRSSRPDSRSSRPDSRSSRPDSRSSRPGSKPSFAARPSRPGTKPRFGSRPDARPSRPDSRPSRPGSRPSFGSRPDRPSAKPWQRRPNTPFRKPAAAFSKSDAPAPAPNRPGEGSPPRKQRWRDREPASSQPRAPRPWQKDRPRPDRSPRREERPAPDARPRENRPFRPQSPRPAGNFAPKFGAKPGGKFGANSGPKFPPKPGAKFSPSPGGKFTGKPGPKFGSKPGAKPRSAGPRSSASKSGTGARPLRPGNFAPRKPNRPAASGPRPPRSGKPKKFGTPPPRGQNPRKNRSQEEKPE